MTPALTPCVGCGALLPADDGPAHAYIGASPGCWAVYGELLVAQGSQFRGAPVGQLTVDTYAAQHPGVPGLQSSQSVAVHLMNLCATLERGLAPEHATAQLTRYLRAPHGGRRMFPWLDPPSSLGPVTVLAVRGAGDAADHTARVRRWARAVWDARAPHHATVRAWLDS
jgi:hypothetical protein